MSKQRTSGCLTHLDTVWTTSHKSFVCDKLRWKHAVCFAQAVTGKTVYLKLIHTSRRRHCFLFSSAIKTEQEIKANKVEVKTQYRFVSSNEEHRRSERCLTMARKHLIKLQLLQADTSDSGVSSKKVISRKRKMMTSHTFTILTHWRTQIAFFFYF